MEGVPCSFGQEVSSTFILHEHHVFPGRGWAIWCYGCTSSIWAAGCTIERPDCINIWAAGTFYILLLRNSPFAQTVILQDIVSLLGILPSSPVPERARAIQIVSRVSESSRRLSLPLPLGRPTFSPLSCVSISGASEAPTPLLCSKTVRSMVQPCE